jgi:flagellar basal-body rod modification protein FlgD
MVDPVTNTSLATSTQKTADAQVALNKDFTQFLSLLTTQLQNQDPLNPMDSNQFTQQLVAMSGVEQQINTNSKLDDLLALQLNTASTVGLGYVGMDVTYTSAEMNHDAGASDTIHYTLASDATTLKVNIYDETGTLVRSMDGGKSSAAANQVVWDGKDQDGNALPAGTYGIEVAASDADGKTITSSTAVKGNVKGIETQDGNIYLLIGDRAVPLTAVIQAVKPTTTADATTPDTDTDTTT